MKNAYAAFGVLFTGAVIALGMAAPVNAQVGMISEDECRCVDPDGNEIENCRCFRTFEPGQFAWDFEPGDFAWSYGWIGSSGARIGVTLSTSPGEDDARGARIQSVLEDGPADKAGIQEGDVVTHINGQSLFDPLDDEEAEEDLDLDASLPTQRLLHLARQLEPGEEVEIRYLRDGESRTVTFEAEELEGWGNVMYFGEDWEGRWDPAEFEWKGGEAFKFAFPEGKGALGIWRDEDDPKVFSQRFEYAEPRIFSYEPEGGEFEIARGSWFGAGEYLIACPGSDEERNYLILGSECIGGLRMEKLNPKLGEYFGTEEGVLVADVHEDSKLGLQAGDVVLRVGDRKATDPDRLRKILRSYDSEEEVTLHIMRQKREMTVSGTLAG
jgi:hypothetical protein